MPLAPACLLVLLVTAGTTPISAHAAPEGTVARGGITAFLEPLFNVDGDGETTPLTDGLLVVRYLFGFRGDTLIAGAVALDCTRCTAGEIETYLEGLVG